MPGSGYVTVSRLEDVVDAQRRSWTLGATMFVAFGALALIVAAVGLYGVIAYSVTQRMHELAVRAALGAQRGDIVRLVVKQALSFAVAGIALGAAIALCAARWIQPLLFGEYPARDPDRVRVRRMRGRDRQSVREHVAGAARDARRSDERASRGVTHAPAHYR